MTLKEKLEVKIMDLPIVDDIIDEIGTNLEYVVDEFAIGFAEWSDNNYLRMGATSMWTTSLDYEDDIVYQTKELLEIYKKEKGL